MAVGVIGLPAPVSAKDRTLHPGDYTKAVERLQRRLQELKFFPGLRDGYYGAETQVAVWAFQKSQGLKAKDEVGPETWQALAHPHRPVPLVPTGQPRRVEIDLRRQLLTVYRHDHPIITSHVSTGSGTYFCQYGNSSSTPTPAGDFHIVERERYRSADPLVTTYETLSFERGPAGDFMSAVTGGVASGFTDAAGHGAGAGPRDRPARGPARSAHAARPDHAVRPVEGRHPARPDRVARQDHAVRQDGAARADHVVHPVEERHPARPDRAARQDHAPRPVKGRHSARPGHAGRPDGGVRQDHAPRPAEGRHPARPVLSIKSEVPAGATGPVRPAFPVTPARPAFPAGAVHPLQAARQDRPDRPLRPDHPLHPLYQDSPASQAAPVPSAPPAAPAPPLASGCVRIPPHIAERIFHLVAVGDPVHVRRETP